MDAFYAAVEQRDHPELRGKAILVGGRGKRGVVTTASYEARVFGCRSAMPTGQALRLCPHAIVVPMRMDAYVAASRQVREVLETFSPDIEPISIDEAFVDLTHVPTWRDRGPEAARDIKRLIRERTRLTASVGVSVNKFLAKVASDLKKPDGLAIIPAEDAAATLAPMKISVLWGVGPVAAGRLEKLGVRTVADLLAAHEPTLNAEFGADAIAHWKRLALGDDVRTVHIDRVNKSIGKERTFGDDIADPERLRAILLDEVEQAARSLREDQLLCGTVVVKLRRPDFRTFTRSHTLDMPTDRTAELWEAARGLFDEFWRLSPGPLRLLGASLQGLTDQAQSELFRPPERARAEKLDAVSDAIISKFGRRAIRRAGGMDDTDRTRRIDGG
jgi:DNA polymerase-4